MDEGGGEDTDDITLAVRVLTFIKPIDDYEACPTLTCTVPSLSHMMLLSLKERIQDQGLQLGVEGTGKDGGIVFDSLCDISTCFWYRKGNLVGKCGHEMLFGIEASRSLCEEERAGKNATFRAQLRDGFGNV